MKRILSSFLIYIIALSPVFAASRSTLPDIGDSSASVLSPAKEAELGAQLMRQFRNRLAIIDDPEVNAYIESLGYRLVSSTDRPYEINFTFFVVNDERINAFAAPGGYIGINAGLILAAETESELAGVVAHEIAHITQRHMARSFELADKMSLPTVAALIGAIILGVANPPLGQASLLAILGGSTQYRLNFTRSNEYEADRLGIHTLATAGFDPLAMPSFFEKMQNNQRLSGIRVPEYLTTHPVTVDRIAESKSRALQLPPPPMTISDQFYLIKAKLEVLTASSITKAIQIFKSRLSAGNYYHKDATEYGYALSLLEGNQLELAETLVNKLYKKHPEEIPYMLMKADLLDKTGNFDAAVAIYGKALHLNPNNYALTINYVKSLIRNKRLKEARTTLRSFLPHADDDPEVYKLLSRVSQELGMIGDAHRYMAEAYYLEGWTNAAIDQLKNGLKQDSLPNYLKQTLEARLETFESIFKQEIKNAKK